jgi:hypothetical protein
MPGDLSNPEMSIPYHYDPRYEPGTNTFEARPLSIEQILQAAARSERGCQLSKDELQKAREYLNGKNLMNRNPGDQEVQETVSEFVKNLSAQRLSLARRVATNYARSK